MGKGAVSSFHSFAVCLVWGFFKEKQFIRPKGGKDADGIIFLFPDLNHFASGRGEISTDPTAQVREWLKATFSGHRRTNSVIQDSGLSPSRRSVQGSAGELDYCSRSKGRGDVGVP